MNLKFVFHRAIKTLNKQKKLLCAYLNLNPIDANHDSMPIHCINCHNQHCQDRNEEAAMWCPHVAIRKKSFCWAIHPIRWLGFDRPLPLGALEEVHQHLRTNQFVESETRNRWVLCLWGWICANCCCHLDLNVLLLPSHV